MQIPELDFEIPPEAQRGSLSTVAYLTSDLDLDEYHPLHFLFFFAFFLLLSFFNSNSIFWNCEWIPRVNNYAVQ